MIIGYKYWLEGTVGWFLTPECWSAKWVLDTQVSSHAVYPVITCLMWFSKHEVWKLVLILIQKHHLTDCRPPVYVPFAESTCLKFKWSINDLSRQRQVSLMSKLIKGWSVPDHHKLLCDFPSQIPTPISPIIDQYSGTFLHHAAFLLHFNRRI